MVTEAFAVFPLSVRGSILGDLTVQAGARVELLVSLAPDKTHGLCYDVAFEATGVRPAEAAFTHRCMESAFLTFSYEQVDAKRHIWRAVGRLAIENVDPPLVRKLMEGALDVAPVWIVMDGGWAQIRVRPIEGEGGLAFAKDVQAFLGTLRERATVKVADLDPAWYHGALDDLHGADPGPPTVDDEPLLVQ